MTSGCDLLPTGAGTWNQILALISDGRMTGGAPCGAVRAPVWSRARRPHPPGAEAATWESSVPTLPPIPPPLSLVLGRDVRWVWPEFASRHFCLQDTSRRTNSRAERARVAFKPSYIYVCFFSLHTSCDRTSSSVLPGGAPFVPLAGIRSRSFRSLLTRINPINLSHSITLLPRHQDKHGRCLADPRGEAMEGIAAG